MTSVAPSTPYDLRFQLMNVPVRVHPFFWLVVAVLGFGINVGLRADQLPVPTATSTRLEGSDVGATPLLAAVLRSLESWFTAWDRGDSVVAEYRRRCDTIGREVVVHLADSDVTGEAVGVDAGGGLVVRTASGHRTFVAGDVEHLRPA